MENEIYCIEGSSGYWRRRWRPSVPGLIQLVWVFVSFDDVVWC